MNNHPRSHTANESGTAEPMLDDSTAVLECGHGIDEETAREILASDDPREAVWCTGCSADFPVATAEFLEDHDADPTLIAAARDRAVPAPFEPEVDADGHLVVDADENVTVPLACGHTEKVFARSSQWDFPTEERTCPTCGEETTWDPAFVARLVTDDVDAGAWNLPPAPEEDFIEIELRCGHTLSAHIDSASVRDGDEEFLCNECDRVVPVGTCPTSLDTLADFADTGSSIHDGVGPITVARLGMARRSSGSSYRLSRVLPDAGGEVDVTVTGPRVAFGSVQGPEVNWSAIGSQSPADAAAYAGLIQVAARFAATAEGPKEEGR